MDISLSALFGILGLLIIVSALFSGSETALMSINRYRLKHLAKNHHKGAQKANFLLKRPDRLIGLILLGNNLANVLASSLSTLIALRLVERSGFGITEEAAIGLAAGLLTFTILIFAEVTPKTLSALHPEKIAFTAAYVFVPLLKVCYPIVYLTNVLSNGILRLAGVKTEHISTQALNRDELKTVVREAGSLIPETHQDMLLRILDLEKAVVEDIMIPRSDIVGINIDDSEEDITEQLTTAQYTRLLAYKQNLDNIKGIIHTRKTLYAILKQNFSRDSLAAIIHQPYYVPTGTSLTQQLINFKTEKRRTGIVVDEYGDVQGMVTLEDILEEIVGDFTSLPVPVKMLRTTEDGGMIVDGSVHVRELNRSLGLKLSVKGPKTLNGLILEYLQDIPERGTSLKLEGHPIEIMQTQGNVIKSIKFYGIRDNAS